MPTRNSRSTKMAKEVGDRDLPPLAASPGSPAKAPGASLLARVAAGQTPRILEALGRSSSPRQIRFAALATEESASELEESLADLAGAGAIELTGADRHRRIVATPIGEEFIGVHQALTRWVRSALLGEEIDPAVERSQMEALIDVWEQEILITLAGRSAKASLIAHETGQKRSAIDVLLARLSLHGMVARVGVSYGSNEPSWVLLRDAKRAAVPLAAAIVGEIRLDSSNGAAVTSLQINALMRLCLEVLDSSHFAARPSGSYAMLCDLPGGARTGWVGQFDGGEIYSIHRYRQGEAVDGGFAGTLEELLGLIATGHWRSVEPFGPHVRGGMSLALAIAVALGRVQGSAA